ncbi:MAG: hypothetical protein RMI91_04820 [Gemmatales bacterium]|nr:hypothetical protein [Gemmatales bacterium]MDW7993958.1 hypothetical protein [Gemmatales bacterium]
MDYERLAQVATAAENEWYRRQIIKTLLNGITAGVKGLTEFTEYFGSAPNFSWRNVGEIGYRLSQRLDWFKKYTEVRERRRWQPILSQFVAHHVAESLLKCWDVQAVREDDLAGLFLAWSAAEELAEEAPDLRPRWREFRHKILQPLWQRWPQLNQVNDPERRRTLAGIYLTLDSHNHEVHHVWRQLARENQRLVRVIRRAAPLEAKSHLKSSILIGCVVAQQDQVALVIRADMPGRVEGLSITRRQLEVRHLVTGRPLVSWPFDLGPANQFGPRADVMQAVIGPAGTTVLTIEGFPGGELKPGLVFPSTFWLVQRELATGKLLWPTQLPENLQYPLVAVNQNKKLAVILASIPAAEARPDEPPVPGGHRDAWLATYDLTAGKKLQEVRIVRCMVYYGETAGLSRDGRWAIFLNGPRNEIVLWDIDRFREHKRIRIEANEPREHILRRHLVVDPSGRYVAVGLPTQGPRIFTIPNGKELCALPVHMPQIFIALPDGEHVILGRHNEREMEIWSLAHERRVGIIRLPARDRVTDTIIQLTSDGQFLILAGIESNKWDQIYVFYIGDLQEPSRSARITSGC